MIMEGFVQQASGHAKPYPHAFCTGWTVAARQPGDPAGNIELHPLVLRKNRSFCAHDLPEFSAEGVVKNANELRRRDNAACFKGERFQPWGRRAVRFSQPAGKGIGEQGFPPVPALLFVGGAKELGIGVERAHGFFDGLGFLTGQCGGLGENQRACGTHLIFANFRKCLDIPEKTLRI